LEDLAEVRLASGESGETVRLDNFEMETAGIYGLANLLGHRALSVSAILANRATAEFSEQPGQTVEALLDAAFALLEANPDARWE